MNNDHYNSKAQKKRKTLVGICIALGVIIVALLSVLAAEIVIVSREKKADKTAEESMESSKESETAEAESAENKSAEAESAESSAGDSSEAESSEAENEKTESSKTEDPKADDSKADDSKPDGSKADDSNASEPKEEESEEEPEEELLFEVKPITKEADDIHRGILQLVNKQHEYLFLDGWLKDIDYYDTYGFILSEYGLELAEPAIQHYCDFLNTFYDEYYIYNIYMMNGYRTPEDAEFLFWRSAEQNGMEHAEKYVMRAGFSEHHTGLASDLGLIEGGPYFDVNAGEEYQWIYDHAHEYGFVLRYSEEKEDITEIGAESWHFRFVGLPCATFMKENNYCLEEFLDMVQKHDYTDPVLVDCETGYDPGSYAIYYQKGTDIMVPSHCAFEVSGDNMEGFVVIVKLPDAN